MLVKCRYYWHLAEGIRLNKKGVVEPAHKTVADTMVCLWVLLYPLYKFISPCSNTTKLLLYSCPMADIRFC